MHNVVACRPQRARLVEVRAHTGLARANNLRRRLRRSLWLSIQIKISESTGAANATRLAERSLAQAWASVMFVCGPPVGRVNCLRDRGAHWFPSVSPQRAACCCSRCCCCYIVLSAGEFVNGLEEETGHCFRLADVFRLQSRNSANKGRQRGPASQLAIQSFSCRTVTAAAVVGQVGAGEGLARLVSSPSVPIVRQSTDEHNDA